MVRFPVVVVRNPVCLALKVFLRKVNRSELRKKATKTVAPRLCEVKRSGRQVVR
jgi:hypothetical protein